MGKVTGFLEFERETPRRRPAAERVNDWFEVYQDFPGRKVQTQARALHGLRRALLPHRLSAEQHHSRLERSGLSRPLARCDSRSACHQQFSGIYGTHLPGAVRGGLRARHQRAAGGDQGDRAHHRRSRFRSGLDSPRAAGRTHRQASGGRRIRARGAGRRATTGARRALGYGVRKRATASAACCATAFPDFKMEKRWIDRRVEQMPPRASSSSPTRTWWPFRRGSAARLSTRC